ncbi:putative flavin-containing amine oxidase [Rosellinia necatrix]|uniref:Amine oxidase n=1 Tax=Rosellinia necatrix TaxID=77044 RepID=A0A1W2TWS9_ROSNE|nr:putative flavin-containing amine oxidase [Rosellinia necatrix]
MYDVAVVGAGLSGLQAAYSAQQAGFSVVVIEARDRVGGKTWSVPLASGRGVADLGAAWINDTKQPRIWKYVQDFGLEVVTQRLVGKAVMQVDDNQRIVYPFGITPEFTPEEKKNLEYIRDHIQAASLTKEAPREEDDDVSLDQYVRNLGACTKTVQMVNLWARVMHGVESTQQSAAWFIDYCRRNTGLLAIRADDYTGGNYMRTHSGTQSIAKGIAELIGHSNIFLSAPVGSIEDSRTHVLVRTTTGKAFAARKCIISVPSTMYRDFNISPPLPPAAREVTDAAIMGHYNKAIVCYDRPWWRDLGFNGFFMSFTGPITLGRDTSVDEKRFFSLTCFVNGKNGEDWSKLAPHDRRGVVLKQLATIFGVGADSEVFKPIEVFDQVWKHEQYSKGALAPVTAIGHYVKFAEVYGKPVGNIHFVGTEYSTEWKGYMEGALCSGEKGAQEVADVLNQTGHARASAL